MELIKMITADILIKAIDDIQRILMPLDHLNEWGKEELWNAIRNKEHILDDYELGKPKPSQEMIIPIWQEYVKTANAILEADEELEELFELMVLRITNSINKFFVFYKDRTPEDIVNFVEELNRYIIELTGILDDEED